jgi:Tat protein translocase TatC
MAQEKQNDRSVLWDLIELRSRLLKAALATLVALIPGYLCWTKFMKMTIDQAARYGIILQTESPTEFLGVAIKFVLLMGFLLAFPVWEYQILMFVIPALYPHERKPLYYLIPFAATLFCLGIYTGLTYGLPIALRLLVNMGRARVQPGWQVGLYLRFVLRLLLATGLFCEIPFITAILGRIEATKGHLLKRVTIATAIVGGLLFLDFLLAMGVTTITFVVLLSYLAIGPERMFALAPRVLRLLKRLSDLSRSFEHEFLELESKYRDSA